MNRILHVLACISNPVGYKSRYTRFFEFKERMDREPNVVLHVVELAFRNRDHVVTEKGNPNHLQLRTDHELWHKENMLNLLIDTLPNDGMDVAIIDADVLFMNPHWVNDTIAQLEHYHVVQMFTEAVDLDNTHKRVNTENRLGIAYNYVHGTPVYSCTDDGYGTVKGQQGGHPGYAWAWRREALKEVGGLIDFSIVGSADWQMACGLMGNIEDSFAGQISEGYKQRLLAWGERAKTLRRNVGYVDGLLSHYWHGPKAKRGYDWRNRILVGCNFDPNTDLHRTRAGVLELHDDGTDRHISLRDGLRQYFRSRNEDSLE